MYDEEGLPICYFFLRQLDLLVKFEMFAWMGSIVDDCFIGCDLFIHFVVDRKRRMYFMLLVHILEGG